MTAQTAEQANNVQRTQNMNMFKKRLCFCKCIKNVFVQKNTVFQTNTKIMHTYGCLGTNWDYLENYFRGQCR